MGVSPRHTCTPLTPICSMSSVKTASFHPRIHVEIASSVSPTCSGLLVVATVPFLPYSFLSFDPDAQTRV
eukprot:scaffold282_cov345-Pavlova_lutheri.AAC.8